MKFKTVLIIILFSFSPLFAGESIFPSYKIPSGSPLTIEKIEKIPPFLYFSGKVKVRAKYQFFVVPDGKVINLQIFPDKTSVPKLPYLVKHGIDEKPIVVDIFEGAEKASKNLLEMEIIQDLISRKQPFVSGEADFIIHKFGCGFECDQPIFLATFIAIGKVYKKPEYLKIFDYSGC